MLNLQGVIVDKMDVLDNKKQILVHCRSPRTMARCTTCGCNSKKVHQTGVRKVMHGILNHRLIVLVLTFRRFKCKKCCKPFTEYFPGISRDKASDNLKIQMLDWLRQNSFSFIAKQFNISASTIVRYLLKMNGDIKIDWANSNITKLGIDEHSFRGKNLIITVTDLSNKKLLAILKSDNQATLAQFIQEIPSEYRDKIDEVCTDLRSSYKPVIERMLPGAILTADRFHVELLAKRALDEIRTVVQDEARGSRVNLKKLLWLNESQLDEHQKIKLELIFKKYENYPILKEAWIIKEKLVRMYWASSREEAEKRFKHIMMLLETSDNSCYLATMRRTLKKWKRPILNYFENKTTNGFTEGCHTKIKLIKRVSYGFKNIDTYIAKMTLAFLPLIWILNYHTG